MADAVTTFRDGRLVLPMAHAVLQPRDRLPFCMEGSGEIRQTHEGVLTFQMHFKVDRSVVVGSLNPALGGPDLIPTTPCTLQLTGFGGEQWTASDVWPDLSFDLEEHGIAKGAIRVLASQCTATVSVPRPSVKYIVEGSLHYPANTAYAQTTTVGDRQVTSSQSLAAATIESDSCKIELFPEGDHTAVTVTALHGADIRQLGDRVLISLQICLGQECRVLTEQAFSEPLFTQRLFSRQISGPPHRWFPPVRIRSANSMGSAWQLFRNLLKFLEAYPPEEQNLIAHHHERLLMSSGSDIRTQLLHLAIAIEAIAEARGKRDTAGREEFSQSKTAAVAAITNEACIPPAHRERLCKAIGSLSAQTNADAVRNFVIESEASDELFKAWKEIRPRAAHGALLDGHGPEQLGMRHGQLVTLFYRLMAKEVGYDGPLANYG
ncbi:MAG: hypothetical protein WCJ18_05065 [Planctomycetota bacterium]